MDLFIRAFWTTIATGPAFGIRLAGRPPAVDEIEPMTRAISERADAIPGHAYLADVQRLQQIARGVVAFFARHHLLLTPVLAERPLRIGELTGCGPDPIADFMRSAQFVPYTALFNATGQPAVSVPMGIAEDGLPTAVQLVARPLCEDVLLQVTGQIEDARPWARLRPPEPAAHAGTGRSTAGPPRTL
jgi:amidase